MPYMGIINDFENALRGNAEKRKVVGFKLPSIKHLDEQDFKDQFGV